MIRKLLYIYYIFFFTELLKWAPFDSLTYDYILLAQLTNHFRLQHTHQSKDFQGERVCGCILAQLTHHPFDSLKIQIDEIFIYRFVHNIVPFHRARDHSDHSSQHFLLSCSIYSIITFDYNTKKKSHTSIKRIFKERNEMDSTPKIQIDEIFIDIAISYIVPFHAFLAQFTHITFDYNTKKKSHTHINSKEFSRRERETRWILHQKFKSMRSQRKRRSTDVMRTERI